MGIPSIQRTCWLAREICPHEPALRRWLLRKSPPNIEIDDVIQEAYAKLALLPDVDHIVNPRAYFFRTAITIILQEVRRAQIVSISALSEAKALNIASDDPSIYQEIESRQELLLVAQAIAELPPRCRETFILRRVHGLSQQETARKLGISESTVEKHVARSVRHLMHSFGRGGKSKPRASHPREPGVEQHGES